MRRLFLALAFALACAAQNKQSGVAVVPYQSDPTGIACAASSPLIAYASQIYTCQSSAYALLAGSGTVTSVGLSMPATLCSITNPPVTTTGTLTCTYATGQTINQIFGTDASGNVGLASLSGAQLPNPSASTLGGVKSLAAVSHNFLTSISTSGVPAQAQPTLADVAAGAAPTGLFDFSGSTNVLLPSAAGAAPTVGGDIRYDSTQLRTVAGGDGAITGSFPRLIYWAHPTSDILCAHGGDSVETFSYGGACNNTAGSEDTAFTAFASVPSIPSGFLVKDKMLRIKLQTGIWSNTGTTPLNNARVTWGAASIYQAAGLSTSASMANRGMTIDCLIIGNAAVGASALTSSDCQMSLPGSVPGLVANTLVPVAVVTNSAQNLSFLWNWSATGLLSGTYTSGITATGTVGQTCALTAFNNGNSGGTATVALTGTNTIAGGTALVITNTGNASSSAATSATAGNGTATCSGTATVATVLGGAQGNALQLRSVTIEELN